MIHTSQRPVLYIGGAVVKARHTSRFAQMWVAQCFPFTRPDRWLTSDGLGTMGFGLPAAIDAALVVPEATTLCFTGDGSLLMNVQELATLADLDLNVKILLLDNGALGLVRQQQELFYQQRFVASSFPRPSRLTLEETS